MTGAATSFKLIWAQFTEHTRIGQFQPRHANRCSRQGTDSKQHAQSSPYRRVQYLSYLTCGIGIGILGLSLAAFYFNSYLVTLSCACLGSGTSLLTLFFRQIMSKYVKKATVSPSTIPIQPTQCPATQRAPVTPHFSMMRCERTTTCPKPITREEIQQHFVLAHTSPNTQGGLYKIAVPSRQ